MKCKKQNPTLEVIRQFSVHNTERVITVNLKNAPMKRRQAAQYISACYNPRDSEGRTLTRACVSCTAVQ